MQKSLDKAKDRKARAMPGSFLERVREALGPPSTTEVLRKVDATSRFNREFDSSLFRREDVVREIMADPADPVPAVVKAEGLARVVNELRPCRQTDSEEVKRLYGNLEKVIDYVYEEDWRAERGVRTNRIAYLN